MTTPTVQTTSGTVRGRTTDEVTAFLGIPYGASTAGANRFRPPQPVEPWDGVRDALELGLRCPQIPSPLGEALELFGEPLGEASDEDCLVLNVWTPGLDDRRRPVFVYLHGGGWVMGSGGAPAYDGAALARRGDVVVLTINHRLGILGFLYLDDVAGPEFRGSGNAGVLDVVAALEWVRDNITAFGGDPASVTLGGQSGGGWKTSTLMAMPAAQGLFHRAIIMSGPMLAAASKEDAVALRATTCEYLGVSTSDVAALQAMPPERLIEAQLSLPPPDVNAPLEFRPVADGHTLPYPPLEAYRRGDNPDIPVLIGTTRDEQTRSLHLITDKLNDHIPDDDAAKTWIQQLIRDHTDAVVDAYRSRRPDASPTNVYVAVTSDVWARGPAMLIAELRSAHASAPAFLYLFSWETTAYEGGLGATHGLDVPFAFDNTSISTLIGDSEEVRGLADAMSEAWLAFIRSGDPSHPGIGEWPPYSVERRSTMVFAGTTRLEDDPLGADRQTLAEIPTELLGSYQIPGAFSIG